jgi:beta-N-acetylhexosaminidase
MNEIDPLVNACLLPGMVGDDLPGWVRDGLGAGLAGVVLFPHNLTGDPDALTRLAGAVRAVRADALVAVDEEGGDVTRLHFRTGSRYPGNLALGVVDDPGLTARNAASIAAELAAAGVNYNLAPSLDVNSDPDNPIIGVRSFGDDPELVARHGVAAVRAMQEAGIAVAVKHFPGHGATVTDSHQALPVIDCDLATFRTRELAPFVRAIEAGVGSIMTAHVVFPALDPRHPVSYSRIVQHTLLREELGFAGVVLSTAVAMEAGAGPEAAGRSAVRALAAGADLLLLGPLDGDVLCAAIRGAVAAAIDAGDLSRADLEASAARIAALRATAANARGRRSRPEVGTEAARRAVRADGPVVLSGPATVAELRAAANVVAGEAHWSLAESLAGRDLVKEALTVGDTGPSPEETVAIAADGPLVVAIRDAYRHPWQRAWVARLLALRPDAVLVAVGMPDDATLTGGPVIRTYGAGLANIEAAVALLADRPA